MSAKVWFIQVVVTSCVSAMVVLWAPVVFRQDAPVQQCDPATASTQAPTGHATCVLKNGQVIYLRSAK